jgi:RNA polymerase sigma factor (sigma-70 family)
VNTIDIGDIYSVFYKRLFHISYAITRDAHLAEDVVHDTFIKAMKKVGTIEEESKVGAWLAVIATRTAIDFVRKENNKKWIPMDREMLECLGRAMKQDVEAEVETSLLREQLQCAIRKLTLKYQDVLMLKLGYGFKEQEIAHILDLKPCTVKTRIYRARKELKLLFQKQVSA